MLIKHPLLFSLILNLSFSAWIPLAIHATIEDPFTTIHIDKKVHFFAADGSDVEVSPGIYTV